jgi:hypothetical protein
MMQWFRAKLNVGARLAIFALALQIAVSFGHMHLGDIRHTVGGLSVAETVSAPSASTQQPVSDPDDYCAICASIYLVASSFLPQAPQLPALFAPRPTSHFDRAAFLRVASRRAPFQSRAPPLT